MKTNLSTVRRAVVLTVLLLNVSLLFSDEWDEKYEQGKLQLERGEWDVAITLIENAILIRPRPDAQAATSNLKLVEYLPYFYLGQSYLFTGDYAKAIENFRLSKMAGAIARTSHNLNVEQLQRMAEQLQAMAELEVANAASASQPKVDVSTAEQFLLSGNPAAAKRELSRLKNKFPDSRRVLLLQSWLRKEERDSSSKLKAQASMNEAKLALQQGLDYFLLGQYEQALAAFGDARLLDPDLTGLRSWIQRTRSEIERLNLDKKRSQQQPAAPEIIERIITQTTAPVFAVPMDNISKTRGNVMHLTGRAGDDEGISHIEITLNGRPLMDSSGTNLQIRPSSLEDAKKFSFAVDVPLQMGENQVVLTAYDVDSPRNRTSERFIVTRMAPIYRTAPFLITAVASILLIFIGVFISKVIKYRIAIVSKYNPYIAGAPIRNESMFFGREKLIKRILNTVHNNSLMIHGPRRIGKTSLQHQLKLRLENAQDPEYEFIPVMIDLQGTSEQYFFYHLMEEIIESCRPLLNPETIFRFHDKGHTYSGRDFSRDLKSLLKDLSQHSDRIVKLVLQLDEVDELNKYSEQVNQKLRSVFMKTFAENLVAVMSGAHIKKSWESEGSPWFNFFEEIEVPPFEKEDAARLILDPVRGIYTYEEQALEKIIFYSKNEPYIIQKFCVQVINRLIEEKRRRVLVRDVDAVAGQVLQNTETTMAVHQGLPIECL